MWCIRMRQGSTSAIASTMLPLRRTRARNRCGGSDVSLRTFGQQIRECDQEIERHLGNLPSRSREAAQAGESALPPRKRKQAAGNTPSFDLAGELVRIAGVDFTRIDGISVLTAQTIISEVGLDMERFKTEGHFASYLGLCPFNAVSGGKVLRRGTRKVVNRAATAFRIAAFTLKNSKSYLGAQYRRFRARLGAPKRSPPWPTNWRSCSTACCASNRNTSTGASNSTKRSTGNSRYPCSTKRPLNWDSLLFQPPIPRSPHE